MANYVVLYFIVQDGNLNVLSQSILTIQRQRVCNGVGLCASLFLWVSNVIAQTSFSEMEALVCEVIYQ